MPAGTQLRLLEPEYKFGRGTLRLHVTEVHTCDLDYVDDVWWVGVTGHRVMFDDRLELELSTFQVQVRALVRMGGQ